MPTSRKQLVGQIQRPGQKPENVAFYGDFKDPPWPQTEAELAAGVTPTYYQYEPGDVRRYGAAGDNSTDDTTPIQNALDSSSVVYFPNGTYKITSAVNVTSGKLIYGDGPLDSTIAGYSTTANGFVVSTTEAVTFRDLRITRTTTTPTSGAAIQFTDSSTENGGSTVDNCNISLWYRGIHFLKAQRWKVSKCYIVDHYQMGIYVQNTYSGDSGDSVITETLFNTSKSGTTYGIYQGAAGGLKLLGNKFLDHTHSYIMNLEDSVTTGILLIVGNSFEGADTTAIRILNAASNGGFTHVVISGNQIAGVPDGIVTLGGSDFLNSLLISSNSISIASGTGACVSLSRGTQVTVNNNVYIGNGGTPTGLVAGSAISNIVYGPDVFTGISTEYNIATSTFQTVPLSDGTTGGTGSAGAGNQYVELEIDGTIYKVLHDGTV